MGFPEAVVGRRGREVERVGDVLGGAVARSLVVAAGVGGLKRDLLFRGQPVPDAALQPGHGVVRTVAERLNTLEGNYTDAEPNQPVHDRR